MMDFIKKNKGAILFYLVIIIGTLAIIYNNKQYEKEKSISTNCDYVDIQK